MTLVEFLAARWDEVEAIAAAASTNDPAHALADIAAKRAIIAEHKPWRSPKVWGHDVCGVCAPFNPWPCPTVRLLALPFAEHPDYNESWR